MTKHILPWVAEATQQFVYANAMQEVFSLALVSGKNAILYGPGGHAKSRVITNITQAVSDATTFVQSFGEGMDESRLYGGIDLPALDAGASARIQYRPEDSFLAAELAVFEELFDAPASVLLSLKDTLTAKELRNGAQRYAMKTSCIIAATNRSPGEVAEFGPSAQALIERFPLQLEVEWPSYEAEDYLKMFARRSLALNSASTSWADVQFLQEVAKEVSVPDNVKQTLAELVAAAVADGHFVSPRTALHALDLVKAAAAIRDADTASRDDLVVVRYLPGLNERGDQLQADIESAGLRAEADLQLKQLEFKIAELQGRALWESGNAMDALRLVKLLDKVADDLQAIPLPDELVYKRTALQDSLAASRTRAMQLSLDWTKI